MISGVTCGSVKGHYQLVKLSSLLLTCCERRKGPSGSVITKNGTAIRKTIHHGFLIKQLIVCHCFDQYVSEKSLSVSLSKKNRTLVHSGTVPDPHLHTSTRYQTNTYTPGHSTRPTITHLDTYQTHTRMDTVQDPHLYSWTQYPTNT